MTESDVVQLLTRLEKLERQQEAAAGRMATIEDQLGTIENQLVDIEDDIAAIEAVQLAACEAAEPEDMEP